MLYVVGQFIAKTEKGNVWDFQGVFDSIDKAESEALSIGPNCFVGPCSVNESLSKETQEWPGCYYPSERT